MKKTFTVWLTTSILCAAGFLPGQAYAWQQVPDVVVDAVEKMKECRLFLAKNKPDQATAAPADECTSVCGAVYRKYRRNPDADLTTPVQQCTQAYNAFKSPESQPPAPEQVTARAPETIDEILAEMDAMSAEMQKSFPKKRLNRISCHTYAKMIRYEKDIEKAKLLWGSCHEQYRLWIPAK